jgi:hypothetical protein
MIPDVIFQSSECSTGWMPDTLPISISFTSSNGWRRVFVFFFLRWPQIRWKFGCEGAAWICLRRAAALIEWAARIFSGYGPPRGRGD